MTEEQKVGEVSPEGGAGSQPSEKVSQQEAKPIDVSSLEKQVSDLQKQLRGLQGRQDKTDNKLDKAQELLNRYDKKLEAGLSPSEARKSIEKEDAEIEQVDRLARIEKQLGELLGGRAQNVVGSDNGASSEVDRLIGELQLDPNDTEVSRIIESGKTGEALENAFLKHRLKLDTGSASVGVVPPKPSSSATHQGDLTPVEKEQKATKLRQLYKEPTKNAKEIKALEAELGWD